MSWVSKCGSDAVDAWILGDSGLGFDSLVGVVLVVGELVEASHHLVVSLLARTMTTSLGRFDSTECILRG